MSTNDSVATPSALQNYNAAVDLIERNLAARPQKVAYIDESGSHTYAELAERVNRCANALTNLGLSLEARVMLCLADTIDFPSVFLGAIKAGLVPVAVNTLLTSSDFDFMLRDSRAQALVVSETLLPAFEPILESQPFLKHVIVSGENNSTEPRLNDLMAKADKEFTVAPTRADDACFWLYSSGSTGTPKGVVHVQTSMIRTAELYAQPILGLTEMLHIFLSNRPGDVRYGSTGKPVPGYDVRLVDEEGTPVAKGDIGELQVSGPTGAAYYWNNRDKSRNTFLGPWTRSGDKYTESDDGYFVY